MADEQIQINSKLKTGKEGQQTADWEKSIKEARSTMNSSAFGGGGGG
jgi:hypothetical protein